jgi:hypothetical protein
MVRFVAHSCGLVLSTIAIADAILAQAAVFEWVDIASRQQWRNTRGLNWIAGDPQIAQNHGEIRDTCRNVG